MSSAPGRTAVTNSQRWDHVGDPRVRPRGAAFWLGPHGLAGAAWSCHGQRRDRGYPTRCRVRCRVNRPVAIRSGPARRRASYLAWFGAFLELAGPVLALGRPRSRARGCRFPATGSSWMANDHVRSVIQIGPPWSRQGRRGRLARPGACGARSRTLGVTRSARAGDGQEPRLSSRAREPVHGRQQAAFWRLIACCRRLRLPLEAGGLQADTVRMVSTAGGRRCGETGA